MERGNLSLPAQPGKPFIGANATEQTFQTSAAIDEDHSVDDSRGNSWLERDEIDDDILADYYWRLVTRDSSIITAEELYKSFTGQIPASPSAAPPKEPGNSLFSSSPLQNRRNRRASDSLDGDEHKWLYEAVERTRNALSLQNMSELQQQQQQRRRQPHQREKVPSLQEGSKAASTTRRTERSSISSTSSSLSESRLTSSSESELPVPATLHGPFAPFLEDRALQRQHSGRSAQYDGKRAREAERSQIDKGKAKNTKEVVKLTRLEQEKEVRRLLLDLHAKVEAVFDDEALMSKLGAPSKLKIEPAFANIKSLSMAATRLRERLYAMNSCGDVALLADPLVGDVDIARQGDVTHYSPANIIRRQVVLYEPAFFALTTMWWTASTSASTTSTATSKVLATTAATSTLKRTRRDSSSSAVRTSTSTLVASPSPLVSTAFSHTPPSASAVASAASASARGKPSALASVSTSSSALSASVSGPGSAASCTHMQKHEYMHVYLLVFLALNPAAVDQDPRVALDLVESDWLRDLDGDDVFTYAHYHKSLFTLADLWTHSSSLQASCELLISLFDAVTDVGKEAGGVGSGFVARGASGGSSAQVRKRTLKALPDAYRSAMDALFAPPKLRRHRRTKTVTDSDDLNGQYLFNFIVQHPLLPPPRPRDQMPDLPDNHYGRQLPLLTVMHRRSRSTGPGWEFGERAIGFQRRLLQATLGRAITFHPTKAALEKDAAKIDDAYRRITARRLQLQQQRQRMASTRAGVVASGVSPAASSAASSSSAAGRATEQGLQLAGGVAVAASVTVMASSASSRLLAARHGQIDGDLEESSTASLSLAPTTEDAGAVAGDAFAETSFDVAKATQVLQPIADVEVSTSAATQRRLEYKLELQMEAREMEEDMRIDQGLAGDGDVTTPRNAGGRQGAGLFGAGLGKGPGTAGLSGLVPGGSSSPSLAAPTTPGTGFRRSAIANRRESFVVGGVKGLAPSALLLLSEASGALGGGNHPHRQSISLSSSSANNAMGPQRPEKGIFSLPMAPLSTTPRSTNAATSSSTAFFPRPSLSVSAIIPSDKDKSRAFVQLGTPLSLSVSDHREPLRRNRDLTIETGDASMPNESNKGGDESGPEDSTQPSTAFLESPRLSLPAPKEGTTSSSLAFGQEQSPQPTFSGAPVVAPKSLPPAIDLVRRQSVRLGRRGSVVPTSLVGSPAAQLSRPALDADAATDSASSASLSPFPGTQHRRASRIALTHVLNNSLAFPDGKPRRRLSVLPDGTLLEMGTSGDSMSATRWGSQGAGESLGAPSRALAHEVAEAVVKAIEADMPRRRRRPSQAFVHGNENDDEGRDMLRELEESSVHVTPTLGSNVSSMHDRGRAHHLTIVHHGVLGPRKRASGGASGWLLGSKRMGAVPSTLPEESIITEREEDNGDDEDDNENATASHGKYGEELEDGDNGDLKTRRGQSDANVDGQAMKGRRKAKKSLRLVTNPRQLSSSEDGYSEACGEGDEDVRDDDDTDLDLDLESNGVLTGRGGSHFTRDYTPRGIGSTSAVTPRTGTHMTRSHFTFASDGSGAVSTSSMSPGGSASTPRKARDNCRTISTGNEAASPFATLAGLGPKNYPFTNSKSQSAQLRGEVQGEQGLPLLNAVSLASVGANSLSSGTSVRIDADKSPDVAKRAPRGARKSQPLSGAAPPTAPILAPIVIRRFKTPSASDTGPVTGAGDASSQEPSSEPMQDDWVAIFSQIDRHPSGPVAATTAASMAPTVVDTAEHVPSDRGVELAAIEGEQSPKPAPAPFLQPTAVSQDAVSDAPASSRGASLLPLSFLPARAPTTPSQSLSRPDTSAVAAASSADSFASSSSSSSSVPPAPTASADVQPPSTRIDSNQGALQDVNTVKKKSGLSTEHDSKGRKPPPNTASEHPDAARAAGALSNTARALAAPHSQTPSGLAKDERSNYERSKKGEGRDEKQDTDNHDDDHHLHDRSNDNDRSDSGSDDMNKTAEQPSRRHGASRSASAGGSRDTSRGEERAKTAHAQGSSTGAHWTPAKADAKRDVAATRRVPRSATRGGKAAQRRPPTGSSVRTAHMSQSIAIAPADLPLLRSTEDGTHENQTEESARAAPPGAGEDHPAPPGNINGINEAADVRNEKTLAPHDGEMTAPLLTAAASDSITTGTVDAVANAAEDADAEPLRDEDISTSLSPTGSSTLRHDPFSPSDEAETDKAHISESSLIDLQDDDEQRSGAKEVLDVTSGLIDNDTDLSRSEEDVTALLVDKDGETKRDLTASMSPHPHHANTMSTADASLKNFASDAAQVLQVLPRTEDKVSQSSDSPSDPGTAANSRDNDNSARVQQRGASSQQAAGPAEFGMRVNAGAARDAATQVCRLTDEIAESALGETRGVHSTLLNFSQLPVNAPLASASLPLGSLLAPVADPAIRTTASSVPGSRPPHKPHGEVDFANVITCEPLAARAAAVLSREDVKRVLLEWRKTFDATLRRATDIPSAKRSSQGLLSAAPSTKGFYSGVASSEPSITPPATLKGVSSTSAPSRSSLARSPPHIHASVSTLRSRASRLAHLSSLPWFGGEHTLTSHQAPNLDKAPCSFPSSTPGLDSRVGSTDTHAESLNSVESRVRARLAELGWSVGPGRLPPLILQRAHEILLAISENKPDQSTTRRPLEMPLTVQRHLPTSAAAAPNKGVKYSSSKSIASTASLSSSTLFSVVDVESSHSGDAVKSRAVSGEYPGADSRQTSFWTRMAAGDARPRPSTSTFSHPLPAGPKDMTEYRLLRTAAIASSRAQTPSSSALSSVAPPRHSLLPNTSSAFGAEDAACLHNGVNDGVPQKLYLLPPLPVRSVSTNAESRAVAAKLARMQRRSTQSHGVATVSATIHDSQSKVLDQQTPLVRASEKLNEISPTLKVEPSRSCRSDTSARTAHLLSSPSFSLDDIAEAALCAHQSNSAGLLSASTSSTVASTTDKNQERYVGASGVFRPLQTPTNNAVLTGVAGKALVPAADRETPPSALRQPNSTRRSADLVLSRGPAMIVDTREMSIHDKYRVMKAENAVRLLSVCPRPSTGLLDESLGSGNIRATTEGDYTGNHIDQPLNNVIPSRGVRRALTRVSDLLAPKSKAAGPDSSAAAR